MSTTISGTTGIDKVQDGTTINASSIMGALNATGLAPIYACRAWVNFNGTGTVAIRASGNVSSITDNGTGNYTVNFTTAMPDANYCVTANAANVTNTATAPQGGRSGAFATTSVGATSVDNQNTATDYAVFTVAIFR